MRGTEQDDVLRGTLGDDVICGLGGDDIILARAGDDEVHAGAGDDTVVAGAGADTVRGGPGRDLIVDRAGENVLDGGAGTDDRCIGGVDTTFLGCEFVLPRDVSSELARREAAKRAKRPARAAAQPPGPRFVREATRVELRPESMTVTFEEVGLPPRKAVNVAITAQRTSTIRCANPSMSRDVAFETSSTAEATETAVFHADAHGRLRGERTMYAEPGKVSIGGLDCKTTERVTVTLQDLTYGPTLAVEQ